MISHEKSENKNKSYNERRCYAREGGMTLTHSEAGQLDMAPTEMPEQIKPIV
jgi:hypothetical protein